MQAVEVAADICQKDITLIKVLVELVVVAMVLLQQQVWLELLELQIQAAAVVVAQVHQVMVLTAVAVSL
jgi:hypothetical protein